MRMVSRPPCCSNIVALLEWFDMPAQVVLVLERPIPCMNLKEFTKLQNGCLSEAQTRDIMLQVIQAARHCCDRGVLHRDIKAQNLLINTDTLQVKLIDFGCGDLLKDTPYKKYAGNVIIDIGSNERECSEELFFFCEIASGFLLFTLRHSCFLAS